MASELLKRQALINKLKEPNVEDVNFDLANSSLDYSIESITEDILPEPKPVELFQEREKVRSERLLNTLDTLEGGLMDESVDFIKRNEMAIGGGLISGTDLGTREGFRRPEDRTTVKVPGQKDIFKRTSSIQGTVRYNVQISYFDPVTRKPKKYTKAFNTLKDAVAHRDKAYPKLAKELGVDVDYIKNPTKAKTFARSVKEFLPKNKKGYITATELSKILDEPEKFVTKAGVDRDSSYVKAVKKLLNQTDARKFGFTGIPGQPFYVYKKPTPKEIKLLKQYKTIQGTKQATGTGYNMVTPAVADRIKLLHKSNFFKNLISSKEIITEEMLIKESSDLNKFLKKNNMNFNQFLRAALRYGEALKGDFLINVTDPILSDQAIKPNKKFADKIYKTFQASVTGKKGDKIRTAVYRAAMADISNQLGQQTTTFGNYKTYLRNRANKILGKGSGIDIDEIVGVSSSARNKTAPYSVFSRFVDASLNQNKLSSFQKALSERTDKLRTAIAKYGPESKQAKDIVKNFNKQIYEPYKADLKAMGAKNVDLPRLTLSAPTSKTLGGGPGRIAELKKQGLDFDEFFRKEKFGYVMPKNVLTQKELLNLEKGELKGLLNQVKKIGCPVSKADGGRVNFSEGLNCFNKGIKVINEGRLQQGSQTRNFIKFFNTASSIAKKTGQGLRLFTKLAIIPEAAIIGVDSALRMSRGDTLDEALKEAVSYIPGLGGKAEEADLSRVSRYLGKDDAKYVRNLRNFQKAQEELNDIISAQDADVALAGTEFDEMSSGESQTDVVERYKPKIAEKEKALQDASISQPEELFARSLEDEFADIKDLKRGLTRRQKRQELNVISPEDPETESLITPEITQADLNKRIVGQTKTIPEEIFDSLIKDEEDSDLKKQKAQELLNLMLALEEQGLTDKDAAEAVENVRRGQFEGAYSDSALAEQLFGPSRTFGGQPVDLENYVPSDRFEGFRTNQGIYAIGGRVGFAEGPKDPNRRFFLKLMGGIMSIPIIGKFLKPLKPAVKQLSNTTTKMPEWFPQLVEKFTSFGTSKKITKKTPGADLPLFAEEATIIEVPQLPGVRFEKYDNGVIKIEGKNAYNEPYEITYEPPGEYKSLQTGKIQKTEGDFAAADTKYYRTGDPREMDYDVDYSVVDDLDDILGGNSTELEGFATGKGGSKYTKGQRAVDEADAAFDYDEPLPDNPAYRPSDARADVIEGPDIDLSDYYDD